MRSQKTDIIRAYIDVDPKYAKGMNRYDLELEIDAKLETVKKNVMDACEEYLDEHRPSNKKL